MTNTEMIRELRALTAAGMKDCKDALVESSWDLQKAVDIVKTKGLNIVSGREGKVASEGVVILSGTDQENKGAALIEINCQTDFVANSNEFIEFCTVASLQLSMDMSFGLPFTHDSALIETSRKELVSKTKEKIAVRRWWIEQAGAKNAKVFSYIHSNNKIG
jgi:elongation factor Ts